MNTSMVPSKLFLAPENNLADMQDRLHQAVVGVSNIRSFVGGHCHTLISITRGKHQSLNDFHNCVDHESGLVTTIEALKQSARISLSMLQDSGVGVSCRVTAWKNQRQWHHSIASYCGECASIDTCGPVGLSLKLRSSSANNNNDNNSL